MDAELAAAHAMVEAAGASLYKAAEAGDIDKVQSLLDAGTVPDSYREPEEGWTALISSAHEGHGKVVTLLLDAGAHVDWVGPKHSVTALNEAAYNGNTDVVAILLKAGASVKRVDKDGLTALHTAAGCGHAETVKLLLASGADKTWKDNSGKTALDLARDEGNDGCVALLCPCVLPPGKCFHFFICHHQGSGSDQAKNLCLLLTARGYNVWYDNNQEATERNLQGCGRE